MYGVLFLLMQQPEICQEVTKCGHIFIERSLMCTIPVSAVIFYNTAGLSSVSSPDRSMHNSLSIYITYLFVCMYFQSGCCERLKDESVSSVLIGPKYV